MFKNITYKKKFIFIIVGFVLLGLAAYKKNFKNIFEVRSQISSITQKLNEVDGSHNQIFFLKNEVAQLNDMIGGQTKNPELVQQLILDFISNSNVKVNIHKIEDTHLYNDGEFNIFTNTIQIEGDYKSLLELLYLVEKDFAYSKVVSAELSTEKNYRNNSKKLYLKLILQNYEKKH